MQWTNPTRVDVRRVVDKYKVYERLLQRNRELMRGFGSPCTYYRNVTLTNVGTVQEGLTRCYCFNAQEGSPDRGHILCAGTGYLEGYQKYGYKEHTYATTSKFSISSSNIQLQPDKKAFVLTGGSLSEYIQTDLIPLTSFRGFDYFLVSDYYDATYNRIEYYYSFDLVEWLPITMVLNTHSLFNRKATSINIPTPTPPGIAFRIMFKKVNSSAPGPKFNSFKFRYRYLISLNEMDPRYSLNMPAFLASRQPPRTEVSQGEFGWKTTRVLDWWVLPESQIRSSDVIEFLSGEYAGQRYWVQEATKYTYGPELQVLHVGFKTELIRPKDDVGRVIYTLM